jgi:putative membrane protein
VTRGELGDGLAMVNALLNGTCAVLLVLGRVAIARKRRATHRALMVSAFVTSTEFLTSSLTRVALTGTHADPHKGWLHVAYLTILLTHMTLAIAVVPMVLTVLAFALRERFDRHRRLARWTFPIWLYVSVTGVVVYVMLYRVPA